MKRYRVLTEWVTLAKTYTAGQEVELLEVEATRFLGTALEAVVESEPVEVEPAKPAEKKATA